MIHKLKDEVILSRKVLEDLEIIDKDFPKACTRGFTTRDGLQATPGIGPLPEPQILQDPLGKTIGPSSEPSMFQDPLGKSLGLSPKLIIHQDPLGESSGPDAPNAMNALTPTDVKYVAVTQRSPNHMDQD